MTCIVEMLGFNLPENVAVHTEYNMSSQHVFFHFDLCPAKKWDLYSCGRKPKNCGDYPGCPHKLLRCSKKVPLHMLQERHEGKTVYMLLDYIEPIAEHISNIPEHIPGEQIDRYIRERTRKNGWRLPRVSKGD